MTGQTKSQDILSRYADGEREFRDLDRDDGAYDFSGADLRGAVFSGSYIFADFKNANLEGADFSNCNVKTCDFSGARLASATFYGSAIDSAIFDGADLKEAIFGKPARMGTFTEAANFRVINYEID